MIEVQIIKEFEGVEVRLSRLEALVGAVCERFEVFDAEVNVAIVGDAEIGELNKQFLNHDGSTDCLSFDLSGDGEDVKTFELMVNAEMAGRQAELRGHSSEAELALYITHGLLHNLGFDDGVDAEAVKMHSVEDEILEQQGFGFVYNRGVDGEVL